MSVDALRQRVIACLQLPEFNDWQSPIDVPNLNRPRTRPLDLPGDGRVAAVMLLLFPLGRIDSDHQFVTDNSPIEVFRNGPAKLGLVLTQRPRTMTRHGGQISLPGGRQDPDEPLQQTACRETFEEIGIPPGQLEVLGSLNPVYIPPTDFLVHPFVGWHASPPVFRRNRDEVDRILVAAIELLADPLTQQTGPIRSGKKLLENVPHFRLGDHQVWGATALILNELVSRLSALDSDQG